LIAQLTAANVNDVTQLEPLVAALPAVRGCPGRPRRKPHVVQGDRAYWSAPRHARLRTQGIAAVVARPRSPHGSGLGQLRWVVERTLAWLHRFRRLNVRYERRADVHEAFLTLGCALITWNYLKSPEPVF
jgi:transposase